MAKKISRRELERRSAQREHSDPFARVQALRARALTHQDGSEVFVGRADQVAERERQVAEYERTGVGVFELQSFDQIIG